MSLLLGSLSFSESASFVMAWIGQAVVYGTLLAGATFLLAKLVGRRVHPAIHGALWLVVLLKFVIPVGPASSWSLASLGDSAIQQWPFTHAVTADTSAAGDVASIDASVAGELLIERPLADSAVAEPSMSWLTVVAIAYALSVFAVATLRVRAYIRFASQCRKLPLADASTVRLVSCVCRTAHLHRRPVVRWSEHSTAPFVFGTFRPTLVLSRRQLRRPEELEAVILHEVAHLRRGDLLVRYVQWFAGTVLFFWPVVAWVNRRIDLALEHACDEWALRHGRLTAGQYARCLLEAVSVRSGRRPGWFEYRPAAMAANVSFLERRIDMILESRSQRRSTRLMGLSASLFLIGWVAFALSGGVAAEAAVDGDDESTFVFGVDDPHMVVELISTDCDPAREEYGIQEAVFEHRLAAMRRIEARESQLKQDREDVLAGYSQTDLDEDGELSQMEFAAFLVAQAVSDGHAVMEQFEDADRNDDGELGDDEAVRLVSPHLAVPFGVWSEHKLPRDVVPGECSFIAQEAAPEGEHGTLELVLESVVEEGQNTFVVAVEWTESDGQAEEVTLSDEAPTESFVIALAESAKDNSFHTLHERWQIAPDVAAWLLDNIDYAPSSDELRNYASMLDAPLADGLHGIFFGTAEVALDSSKDVHATEGELIQLQFGAVELVLEAELEDDESDN